MFYKFELSLFIIESMRNRKNTAGENENEWKKMSMKVFSSRDFRITRNSSIFIY